MSSSKKILLVEGKEDENFITALLPNITDHPNLPNLNTKSPIESLQFALETWGENNVILASSLGAEDQVLTHMLSTLTASPRVFVLDTGRLHEETYEVLHLSMKKYPTIRYEIYTPDTQALQTFLTQNGPNSFYESIENRKKCCEIRKTHPLQKALSGKKAWITGLRRSQSVTRADIPVLEWDGSHGLAKLNPIAEWTEDQVWEYLNTHDIPTNRLHKQGYPSIGCAPCTRAIKAGEDIRAGRWWWENADQKECGLHVKGKDAK
jgi:phosphoadenosine phosphosulfate reductase